MPMPKEIWAFLYEVIMFLVHSFVRDMGAAVLLLSHVVARQSESSL